MEGQYGCYYEGAGPERKARVPNRRRCGRGSANLAGRRPPTNVSLLIRWVLSAPVSGVSPLGKGVTWRTWTKMARRENWCNQLELIVRLVYAEAFGQQSGDGLGGIASSESATKGLTGPIQRESTAEVTQVDLLFPWRVVFLPIRVVQDGQQVPVTTDNLVSSCVIENCVFDIYVDIFGSGVVWRRGGGELCRTQGTRPTGRCWSIVRRPQQFR